MNLFRLRKNSPATVIMSFAVGAVIAVPICMQAAAAWQHRPDVQVCTSGENVYESEENVCKSGENICERKTEAFTESAPNSYYGFVPLPEDEQTVIYTLCEEYEIAYDLMLAVARTESGFRMDAVGVSGDKGMFQINEFWADKPEAADLPEWRTDLADNTELALRIMSECLETTGGDLDGALNCYNSGRPDEVWYPDGTSYRTRVFENYEWIMKEAQKWTLTN